MGVELKAGLWGVSRDRRVWGPFEDTGDTSEYSLYQFSAPGVERMYRWTKSGTQFTTMEDRRDIVAVFNSRKTAEAWLNRKPWYRLLFSWIRKHWYPTWATHPFVRGFIDGLVIWSLICAAVALTSCTSPTAPAVTCKTQGWNDSAKAWVWYEVPCDTAAMWRGGR